MSVETTLPVNDVLTTFVKDGVKQQEQLRAAAAAAIPSPNGGEPTDVSKTAKAADVQEKPTPAVVEAPTKPSHQKDQAGAKQQDGPAEGEKKDKQIKDTRDALTRERKLNLELQGRLDTIGKKLEEVTQKLDGTWEKPATQEKSVDQIRAEAKWEAKVKASELAAKKLYGDEEVEKSVTSPESPYLLLEREFPWIGARVAASDEPVIEAMRVLKEQALFEQYGTRDWLAILEQAKDDAVEAAKEKIVNDATAQLQGKHKKTDSTMGLSQARGVAVEEPTPAKRTTQPSLNKVFPHFAPR